MKSEQIYAILVKEGIEYVSKIKELITREVKGLKIITKKGRTIIVGKGFLDKYNVGLVVDQHSGKANSWAVVPKKVATAIATETKTKTKKKRTRHKKSTALKSN